MYVSHMCRFWSPTARLRFVVVVSICISYESILFSYCSLAFRGGGVVVSMYVSHMSRFCSPTAR
jgi:hypothetical protein